MINPWPVVVFDGQAQSCLVIDLFTDPVVIDGLEVDWGRTEYMSHTGVAALKVEWLDRTGHFAARMRDKTLIGKPISVHYTDGTGWGEPFYQGRITGAAAQPDVLDPWATDPEARCWRVSVTAADKTADLAQIIQPTSVWPEETMQARAVALRGASFIAGIAEFYFFPQHVNSVVYSLDVKGRDNLALLKDMYYSMGDTFAYLPDENVVRYLHRRAYDVHANWVQSSDGVIRMTANDHNFDGRVYRGVGIQGCDVTADTSAGLPVQSTVTRVEASWKDTNIAGDPDSVAIVYADELDELDRGRRTLTFTSWLGDMAQMGPVCNEVLNRGRFEGSAAKHPNIQRHTARTGGFYNRGEARALLMGGETQGVVYISGSRYAMWLVQQPFYAVLGGTIRYVHPYWEIDLNLQWHLQTNTPIKVKWSAVTPTLKWTQPPVFGSLSDSMTWWDAANLQTGNVYPPTEP